MIAAWSVRRAAAAAVIRAHPLNRAKVGCNIRPFTSTSTSTSSTASGGGNRAEWVRAKKDALLEGGRYIMFKLPFKFLKGVTIMGGVGFLLNAVVVHQTDKSFMLPDKFYIELDFSSGLADDADGGLSGIKRLLRGGESLPIQLWDLVQGMYEAAKDDRVCGVLGLFSDAERLGSKFASSQEAREAIEIFTKSGKLALAYGDTFGEGGSALCEYWVASGFTALVMQPSGYLGLVGPVSEQPFFKRLLQKYGLRANFITRYEYKTAASSFTQSGFTPAHREATHAILSGVVAEVVNDISATRGLPEEKVRALLKKGPLTAKEAEVAELVTSSAYRHDLDKLSRLFGNKAHAPREAGRAGGETLKKVTLRQYVAHLRYWRTRTSTFERLKRYFDEELAQTEHQDQSQQQGPPQDEEGEKQQEKGKYIHNPLTQGIIAIIHVRGPIQRGIKGWNGDGAVSRDILDQLSTAKNDKRVAGVILRVDSPGGSAVASDSIARAVSDLIAFGKPVVCSMGNLAASGGYMIAAPCTRIISQPTTLTGSIGVIAGKINAQELLKRHGVDVETITDFSDNGTAFSPFSDFTPAQLARLEENMDDVYTSFLGHVCYHRRLSAETMAKIAKGRVWTGRQAMTLGLVDEMGGYAASMRAVYHELPHAPKGYRVMHYSSRKPPLGLSLLQGLAASGGSTSRSNILPPAAVSPFSRALFEVLLLGDSFRTSLRQDQGLQLRDPSLPISLQ
jgi:protease-4